MSFRELIETSQSVALAEKLIPTDSANWHYFCREYSKTFHTPLHEVLKMNPEFVVTQIYAEMFAKLDVEEQSQEIQDIISSLSDPEFDVKKERAYREEMRRIVEEENQRLDAGEDVHPSLKKEKMVATKEQPQEQLPKELPKSGGINMNLIRQLNNEENDGDGF